MTPYGTHTRHRGEDVLRYERRLTHPVDAVWAAVTRPEEFPGWLGEADIDLRPGGDFEFRWLNGDVVARGTVTALDPPRLVEYDSDVHGRLRFELAPDGPDGCVLTFVCTVGGLDREKLGLNLAGWHIHLDFLEESLAGKPFDWSTWDPTGVRHWETVRAGYEDRTAG
jgi:uncharacterized protein YndB with AHSA1/START domain